MRREGAVIGSLMERALLQVAVEKQPGGNPKR